MRNSKGFAIAQYSTAIVDVWNSEEKQLCYLTSIKAVVPKICHSTCTVASATNVESTTSAENVATGV